MKCNLKLNLKKGKHDLKEVRSHTDLSEECSRQREQKAQRPTVWMEQRERAAGAVTGGHIIQGLCTRTDEMVMAWSRAGGGGGVRSGRIGICCEEDGLGDCLAEVV